MSRFVFNEVIMVPKNRIEDTRKLREYIETNLKIKMSLLDTYLFWDSVSSSWCAGWLSINTHYSEMTRDEFLLSELEKYGYIVED